ncbi:mucin-2-like [Liolophura sinensis]|uniref:mucin-2-like n=1 Tax=Liolophura sinensis TaxID=3198878 RepID=UPI00315807A0
MFFLRIPFACLSLASLAVCHESRSGSAKLPDGDVNFRGGNGNNTDPVVSKRMTFLETPFHPDDLFRTIAEGNSSQSRHHDTVSDSGLNSHHLTTSTTSATATTPQNSTQKTVLSTKQSTGRPEVTTTASTTPTSPSDYSTLQSTTRPIFVTETRLPELSSDDSTVPKSTTQPTFVTETRLPELSTDDSTVPKSTTQPTFVTETRLPELSTDDSTVPKSTNRPTFVTETRLPELSTDDSTVPKSTAQPTFVTETRSPELSSDDSTVPKSTNRPTFVTETRSPELSTDDSTVPKSTTRPTFVTETRSPELSTDDSTVPKSTNRPTFVTETRLPELSTDDSTVPKSTNRPTFVTETRSPELSTDDSTVPKSTTRPTFVTETRSPELSTDYSTVQTSNSPPTSATDNSNDTTHGKVHVSKDSMPQGMEPSVQFIPDVWVIPERRTFETLKPFSPDDFGLNSHHTTPASTTGATAATSHKSTQKTVFSTKQLSGRRGVTTTAISTPVSPSNDSTVPKSITRSTSVTATQLPELSTGDSAVPTASIQTGLSDDTSVLTSASTRNLTGSVTDDTNDADLDSIASGTVTSNDVSDQPVYSDTPTRGLVITDTSKNDHEITTTTASLSDNTPEPVTKLPVPISALDRGEKLPNNPSASNLPAGLPGISPPISPEKSDTLRGKVHTPTMQTITERIKGRMIEGLLPAPMAVIAGEEPHKRTPQLEHFLEEIMADLVPRVRAYIRHLSYNQKVNFLDEFIQKYKAQILRP